MKFFQKRTVAIVITGLVILGCLLYGWGNSSSKPEPIAPAPLPDLSLADGEAWVRDDAGVLSADTRRELAELNAYWDAAYDSVVAFVSTESTGGAYMEDYAYDFGTAWGLGQNDMLLLVVPGEMPYLVLSNSEIVPDKAADKAGIRVGDYVVSAGGEELLTSNDLLRVRRQYYVGDELTMTLWRDGEIVEVTLQLQESVED